MPPRRVHPRWNDVLAVPTRQLLQRQQRHPALRRRPHVVRRGRGVRVRAVHRVRVAAGRAVLADARRRVRGLPPRARVRRRGGDGVRAGLVLGGRRRGVRAVRREPHDRGGGLDVGGGLRVREPAAGSVPRVRAGVVVERHGGVSAVSCRFFLFFFVFFKTLDL